jgi:MSHA biogenesis protein MshQ
MKAPRQYATCILQTLFVFVCCIFCSAKSWAVACDAIFTNGIQATGATGNINLNYHSLITGGSATLKTKTLTDNTSWSACSGSICVASGAAATTSTVAFSTGPGSDGPIAIANNGNLSKAAGDYKIVSVGQAATLSFTTANGTYKTTAFSTNLQSIVRLESGDYWVNGNLTIGQQTILRRIATSGTTRIFVNGNIYLGYQVATQNFTSNQLLIYATGTITSDNEINVSAFLYAGGLVSLDYASIINGAISGSGFKDLNNQLKINYQPASLSTANFAPFCTSSPSAISYFGISMNTTGVTCAAEAVTIRAYDSVGNAVAPTAGTQITLTTTPNTGVWAGGNTYSFSGSETFVTKYLQQTSGATLNVNVTDGSHSELGSLDPSITFANAGLRFSTIATQEAGVDGSVSLQAVRTDNDTGACVAQVTGTQPVKLAYVCNNPTTCVSGQPLTLAGTVIQGNPNTALLNPAYTTVNLTFDGTGTTTIPLKYSDVGRLSFVAQLSVNASGVNPAITLSGTSAAFVVKPYSLAISAVQDVNGVANRGGTNVPADRFVSAGTNFKVLIQARDSSGNPTPNFGNENTSKLADVVLTATSVTYPSGVVAVNPALSNTGNFVATTPAGTFVNASVAWKQVGSIVITPSLTSPDYLGGGDITRFINSGTVGRFFPDRFALNSLTFTNSCVSFAYMSQPFTLSYTLQAQATDGTKLTNFQGNYGLTNLLVNARALPTYVAETNNTGDGASKSSRVIAVPAPTTDWSAGDYNFSGTLQFTRQTLGLPDGPFDNLQLGIGVTDAFDGRSIQGADMDATTATSCAPACNAKTVGIPLSMRYGRLRLDDAFGPETVKLPVNFATEYWLANRFILNADDSCTLVPRSAITYPAGAISVDANRTVTLTGGSTQGTYTNLTSTNVGFNAGTAGQQFTAPGSGTGSFVVVVDLTNLAWLRSDWNQDGDFSDVKLPNANFTFGSYRGNDRIIYWREKLQ